MNLKERRTKKGMTQTELAAAAGISAYMISAIERGVRRPSVELAKRIGSLLGFDWTQFYK